MRTYRSWTRKFAEFVFYKSPLAVTPDDVKNFLAHLALKQRVAASSQNQAFNALLFLFRHVLVKDMDGLQDTPRAASKRNLPVVLAPEEVQRLLSHMSGVYHLMAELIYGTGLRVSECTSLRVKDLDFANNNTIVRNGKGNKDRVTLLPDQEPLQGNRQSPGPHRGTP